MPDLKVSISPGNIKMGAIPSVSLPVHTTCNKNAPCFRDCYARKICALRPSVAVAYENNLKILQTNPDLYWDTVYRAAKMSRYFRFHVGGDIPNTDYYCRMLGLAKELPNTEFLCFTKQYQIVNGTTDNLGLPPNNLHLIFSDWPGAHMENPFSFPVCKVLFKNETPLPEWVLCSGNCTECAIHDGGCWTLKHGDTIAIPKH